MRAHELKIVEAKIIQLPSADEDTTTKLWQNPSHNDLTQLLKKFDLRGLAWYYTMIVWNSYDAYHADVERQLMEYGIVDRHVSMSFILSNNSNFSEYEGWSGQTSESNGIYYMADSLRPEEFKPFARALRMKKEEK